jgi:hypothetical protein
LIPALEPISNREKSAGEPQHRRSVAPTAARFVRLRRPVQPWQQEGLVPLDRIGNQCGRIVGAEPVVNRGERGFLPRKVQGVKPASQPQRQRIGKRRPGPFTHAQHHRAAAIRLDQFA